MKKIRSIAIIIFLLIAVFNISFATSEPGEIIEYTISKGETLWSIASQYTSTDKDIRETIYNIKKLNNMKDSTVYEGQTIQIKKGQ